MRRLIISKSTADFTSHAGLGLSGMAIRQRTNLAAEAAAVWADAPADAMPHGDILASYIGLLCLGKSDFEAIDAFRADPYFLEALGLGQVPSAATLRERLDAHAVGFNDAVIEASHRVPVPQQCPDHRAEQWPGAAGCGCHPDEQRQDQERRRLADLQR